MEKKKMYHVEKFIPPECTNCRAPFKKEGEDYCRLFGDIVDGHKRVRETVGYTIKQCEHCQNCTATMLLETYQLSDKAKAEELCEKEGFVNLIEVFAVGTHCQDSHAFYMGMPGTRVMAVKCNDN